MESYLPISFLNDFIFCPRSIYFHNLYGAYKQELYHVHSQTRGKAKHKNIDKGTYSTAKKYLLNFEVYSEKYKLHGKIDIYDQEEKNLVERKYHIQKIYDGYRYQLYAQYFCLEEMGLPVENLFLHSLKDNRRYPIPIPTLEVIDEFEELIQKINSYNLLDKFSQNQKKCIKCIYNPLCDAIEN